MATNSNTKQDFYQVNSFAKGMDTDTSDALINSDSYRLAKNLRYITNIDENTGELRLIEGVTKINVGTEDNDDKITNAFIIRAFCSIRNIGALVCERSDHKWAVFRIEYGTEVSDKWTSKLVFGWCDDFLSGDTKVSATIKYEDTDKVQLYIADGKHSLMKINLYDEAGSTDIRYVSNGLSFSDLNKVQIDSILTGGQLEAGLVQYSYRLYNNNNVATQIAPLSNVKAITNQIKAIGPIGLQNQQKSSMGLRVTVQINPTIYTLYPKIQLYRIQYLVNGQQPKIQLIFDGKVSLNNNTFVYNDLGSASLQELTAEEFNTINGIYIQPTIIESKDNILFAGSIKYEIDVLDEDYLNMDFRAFSYGDGVTYGDWPKINDNRVNTNLDLSTPYDESKWKTITPGEEGNIGGCGQNISWKFGVDRERQINSFPLELHPGTTSLQVANSGIGGTVKRGLMHDEVYRYGIILYSKKGTKYPVKWIADIRTPNINGTLNVADEESNYIRSLSHLITGETNGEIAHLLYPIFKLDDNLVFKQDEISGYEIVRVHRSADDRATISQGVIASTVQKSTWDEDNNERTYENQISSSGMPFLDHTLYINNYTMTNLTYSESLIDSKVITDTNINVLQFYSPETSYQTDDVQDVLNTTNSIYLQCLYPLTSATYMYSPSTPSIPSMIAYAGEQYSNLTPYCTNNMYSYEQLNYKLQYALGNNGSASGKRFKWYNALAPIHKTHFLDNTSQDTDYLYESLDGFNVYKLHRSTQGMPDKIQDESHPLVEPTIVPTLEYNIDDFALVNHIDYNKLVNSQLFHGKDYQSVVGDYTFFNCIAPFIIADNDGSFNVNDLKKSASNNRFRDELIATCDPSLAITLDSIDDNKTNIINYFYKDYNFGRGDALNCCEYSMLCNIRRNVIPYGGYTEEARNNSVYTQSGYYYPADYRDDIKMYNGDTTVSTFEFVTAHKWYDATYTSPKDTIICQVAVESVIDMDFDSGDRFSNNKQSNPTLVQVQPCNFNNEYIQKNPSYVYNTAYSIDPQLLLASGSLETIENSIKNFDYRVHYSNPASDNQAVDPWLVFQPLNYLDVDSKYGAITNMRTFKNQLVFWQQTATGVLSVNERVQIAVESNLPLALGTGGVLERFDYLTTTNGMKENQYADAQSDNTLYWWDYDNNTICAYTRGSVPVQLSKVKQVQNLLNRANKNDALIASDIEHSKYPLLIYDNKYNEVLFKLGKLDNTDSDNTLVYSEQQQAFTSIYDINPQCYFDINGKLMFLHSSDMYFWNEGDNQASFEFDETGLKPYLKYVVNNQSNAVKVYDNVEFAGTIPNSDNWDEKSKTPSTGTLTKDIKFEFNTPLKQVGKIDGTQITNRQLDFKFAVPRRGEYKTINDEQVWVTTEYGDRMRGKTMQCAMSSDSNSLNFSLQYIITKYRISWS